MTSRGSYQPEFPDTLKEKPDGTNIELFEQSRSSKMLPSIFTSLGAIMPQTIAVGDISVTFNGDGWIVAVMLLIGIVLCGRR